MQLGDGKVTVAGHLWVVCMLCVSVFVKKACVRLAYVASLVPLTPMVAELWFLGRCCWQRLSTNHHFQCSFFKKQLRQCITSFAALS